MSYIVFFLFPDGCSLGKVNRKYLCKCKNNKVEINFFSQRVLKNELWQVKNEILLVINPKTWRIYSFMKISVTLFFVIENNQIL